VTDRFTVIIPSRWGSTRLPAKALTPIHGRPLVQHAWESARASRAVRVCIATDDERIAQAARAFGADVLMTSAAHVSGTDRLAEAATHLGLPADGIVVNVQGDEVGLPPALVDQVAELLAHHADVPMATLCEPFGSDADAADPANVKVVFDAAGRALYFSRAPVPWSSAPHAVRYRHIGLYAYRAGFLRTFTQLAPSALEQCERLEQLRALHHGFAILVAPACAPAGIGIDTPADLARAAAWPEARRPTSRDT
jgi:3-deoxy-manno-octulosonate cytidylyltransferase (CMP-KDO synthetase)